jgi:hypothetical protein
MAVAHGDGILRVQLGDGAGGLGAPIAAGPAGYQPRLADLDGDGNLDAVAVNDGFVTALRGHGDGSFSPIGNFAIRAQPAGWNSAMSTGMAPDVVAVAWASMA